MTLKLFFTSRIGQIEAQSSIQRLFIHDSLLYVLCSTRNTSVLLPFISLSYLPYTESVLPHSHFAAVEFLSATSIFWLYSAHILQWISVITNIDQTNLSVITNFRNVDLMFVITDIHCAFSLVLRQILALWMYSLRSFLSNIPPSFLFAYVPVRTILISHLGVMKTLQS